MAVVPGLLQIPAVIDGDAIKPRAAGRLAPELIQLAECFQKNVMRGVLGFLRVAQVAQGQIINGLAVLVIDVGELRVLQNIQRGVRQQGKGSGRDGLAWPWRPRAKLRRAGAPALCDQA